MKFFLDTANIDEIKEGFKAGVLDGVTTNPSLIKKEVDAGRASDIVSHIKTILSVAGNKPVSLEVECLPADEMIKQALKLYKLFSTKENHIVIKIPFNPTLDMNKPMHFEGVKAIRTLTSQGISVNVTLIFTPEQALIAAKAGATYVSPFAGRIDDLLRKKKGSSAKKEEYYPEEGVENKEIIVDDNGIVSGVHLVEEIAIILDNYKFKTEIIASSIRNARQAREVALVGSHIATIPMYVLKDMAIHQKSLDGAIAFTNDTVEEYAKLMR